MAGISLPGRPTRGRGLPAAAGASPVATATFAADPFTLGVASGDSLPDGVVIWTRLAPDPINGGGLEDQGALEVRWELAADQGFNQIVRQGAATATPELAHSVHVDLQGLEPGRDYFYRFMAGSEVSPVGRTRTAPPLGAAVDRMAFAFASCQDWQEGYFPAYRHMAGEDLDLVIHLGDYIL